MVPFYSDKYPLWEKIGSKLHLVAVHLIFIVIPLFSIGNTLINAQEAWESPAVGVLLAFPIINAVTILYYFVFVLKVVRGAWTFISDRNTKKIRMEEKQEDTEVYQEKNEDYFRLWRGHGEGPIRIGRRLDIG